MENVARSQRLYFLCASVSSVVIVFSLSKKNSSTPLTICVRRNPIRKRSQMTRRRPCHPLRSAPKAASRPSRQKQFPSSSHTLASLFTSEEAVIKVASNCLRVLSYGYLFYAWAMVMTNAFNGAGDTMTPTWLNIICFWIVQIPLAWFLAHHWNFGPDGVFWAVVIAESLLAVLSIAVFLRGRWKLKSV
jgi:hypothetical protein